MAMRHNLPGGGNATKMQRPPDDLPSAAPRSRHSLLPPPRPPLALRLHNTSQEKEPDETEERGTDLTTDSSLRCRFFLRSSTFCTLLGSQVPDD